MNFVLKEEGFLDGQPGNYSVTEKGEKYAEEQDHSRGTGGYSWYNKAWSTRTWDDGIKDELDITEDRKKEIRQAILNAKQKIHEMDDECIAIENDSYSNEDAYITDSDDDALIFAVRVLLLAVSTYGIYKAAPYINCWWNDKVIPSLKKMKNKISGKAGKMYEETDRDTLQT